MRPGGVLKCFCFVLLRNQEARNLFFFLGEIRGESRICILNHMLNVCLAALCRSDCSSAGTSPDGGSWRVAMFDERVRALHGKRSSRRKYGDARKRVFAQPGRKQAEVSHCACACVWCVFFQARRDQQQESGEDLFAWRASFTPQTWKSEVCVCVCVL